MSKKTWLGATASAEQNVALVYTSHCPGLWRRFLRKSSRISNVQLQSFVNNAVAVELLLEDKLNAAFTDRANIAHSSTVKPLASWDVFRKVDVSPFLKLTILLLPLEKGFSILFCATVFDGNGKLRRLHGVSCCYLY